MASRAESRIQESRDDESVKEDEEEDKGTEWAELVPFSKEIERKAVSADDVIPYLSQHEIMESESESMNEIELNNVR